MTTYNVNDNINFTQFGITANGTITKVIKVMEDGSAYYQVTYGKYNSKAVVATEEIEEGKFSALITFIREGVQKTLELCSVKAAEDYLYNVIEPNGWEFVGLTRGTTY